MSDHEDYESAARAQAIADARRAQSRGLEYVYPLRPDFDARVVVPRDLTLHETRRLAAFLATLAMPENDIGRSEIRS